MVAMTSAPGLRAFDRFNLVGLLFIDQVLVQNDDISEFDLVDQQVGHGAIVLLTEGFTTGLE